MAKKKAEQAKLLAEQEAQRAAQAPREQPAAQASTSSEAAPATGKKSKAQKKRDNAALAAAAELNMTSMPTSANPSTLTHNSGSNTNAGEPANPAQAEAQITQKSVTTIPDASNAQVWPSPYEETTRRSATERDEQEKQGEESTTRSVSSTATSPSTEKKKRE